MVEEKSLEELEALAVELAFACPPVNYPCAEEEFYQRRLKAKTDGLEASLSSEDLLRLKCLYAIRFAPELMPVLLQG